MTAKPTKINTVLSVLCLVGIVAAGPKAEAATYTGPGTSFGNNAVVHSQINNVGGASQLVLDLTHFLDSSSTKTVTLSDFPKEKGSVPILYAKWSEEVAARKGRGVRAYSARKATTLNVDSTPRRTQWC